MSAEKTSSRNGQTIPSTIRRRRPDEKKPELPEQTLGLILDAAGRAERQEYLPQEELESILKLLSDVLKKHPAYHELRNANMALVHESSLRRRVRRDARRLIEEYQAHPESLRLSQVRDTLEQLTDFMKRDSPQPSDALARETLEKISEEILTFNRVELINGCWEMLRNAERYKYADAPRASGEQGVVQLKRIAAYLERYPGDAEVARMYQRMKSVIKSSEIADEQGIKFQRVANEAEWLLRNLSAGRFIRADLRTAIIHKLRVVRRDLPLEKVLEQLDDRLAPYESEVSLVFQEDEAMVFPVLAQIKDAIRKAQYGRYVDEASLEPAALKLRSFLRSAHYERLSREEKADISRYEKKLDSLRQAQDSPLDHIHGISISPVWMSYDLSHLSKFFTQMAEASESQRERFIESVVNQGQAIPFAAKMLAVYGNRGRNLEQNIGWRIDKSILVRFLDVLARHPDQPRVGGELLLKNMQPLDSLRLLCLLPIELTKLWVQHLHQTGVFQKILDGMDLRDIQSHRITISSLLCLIREERNLSTGSERKALLLVDPIFSLTPDDREKLGHVLRFLPKMAGSVCLSLLEHHRPRLFLKDNSGEDLLDRLFRLTVHKLESSWLFKTVDPVGFIGRIATDAMDPLRFYTQGCIGNGWVVNELLHYIHQNPSEYVLIISELLQGRPVLLRSKTIHAATESETEPDDTLRPIHRRVMESILMKFYIPQYHNANPNDRMRAGGAGKGVEEALFGYKLITHLKGTPKSRLLALMKAHLTRYPFVTAMIQWKDKYHAVKIFRILDDRVIWINPWGPAIHSDEQVAVIHLAVSGEMEQEAPSFETVSLVEFFQRLIAINIHAMVTLEASG